MSFNLLKDFLVMSLKHKAEKVNWEELGTNASLLPLIYFIVMAPGFLCLLGLSCLLATGVAYVYFGPDIPVEYFSILGGSLIGLGVLLVIIYRTIIKHQFKLKKNRSLEQEQTSLQAKSPIDRALQPFMKQLVEEHRLFLNDHSLKEKQ